MPSTTVSQHNTGPTPMHMMGAQHGLNLPVGPHHSSAPMVPSQHLPQTHLIQDISDISTNKRPRLALDLESRAPIHQPLLIDTRDIIEVKKVIILYLIAALNYFLEIYLPLKCILYYVLLKL